MRLYRPDGLVEVARIAADSQRTLSLDFDPSGRWLAFAGDMRRLHVVEVSNPSNRRTIAFDYSIWGLRWHPDGRRIAVADRGSGVRIVQVPDDGSPLTLSGSFVGHDAEVWAVAWSPAGDRLYSIGQTEVHAWDEKPNGGPARHELGSPGLSLAHAADGSATALTADGSIWRVPASIDAGPERAWQGDAFLAFAACSDMPRDRHAWVSPEGRLRIAEPATGRVVERSHPVFADSVNVARFSPGGTRIALLGKSPKDPLLICNAVTGDEIARLSLEWTIQPAGLAWIDEDRLYAGSFGRAFEIRRHRDGAWKIVRPIEGAFMAVREATPDGHVLTASMSGQIIERDLADGHVVRTYGRVSDMVGCIALSADGSLIASSGTDRRLHLFDRASGEQLLALMGHERGRRVMAVDFSAGGDRVLTLDNAGGLVTWDTRPAASRPQDAPPAQ